MDVFYIQQNSNLVGMIVQPRFTVELAKLDGREFSAVLLRDSLPLTRGLGRAGLMSRWDESLRRYMAHFVD
jgi:hypothetical protein